MKDLEKPVRDILEAVGRVNRMFRDAAIDLERLPQVERAATSLEIIDYESGTCIEGYIDAELKNGNGISWCFDLTWDADSWLIRGTLERNSASGNEVLERVPPENVPQATVLPQALIRAAEKLIELRPQEIGGGTVVQR